MVLHQSWLKQSLAINMWNQVVLWFCVSFIFFWTAWHDGSGKITEGLVLHYWADLSYAVRRFCHGKEENCFTAQNNQNCVPDKWSLITCLSAKLLDCAYKSRLGFIGICNPGLEMKHALLLWFSHHQYWWASFPASSAEFFSWLLSAFSCLLHFWESISCK